MNRRLVSLLRGALCALGAMALYAVSLGCFIALLLLVVSMEEGGESLPSFTMSLTEAVILLSQGVGFSVDKLPVTIMPLLLTALLVLLVRQCARRAEVAALGWLSGGLTWIALNLVFSGGTGVSLHDSPLTIAGKSAAVWTVGVLLASLRASTAAAAVRRLARERVPHAAKATAALAFALAAVMLVAVLLTGFVVCVMWIVRGWNGMVTLFELDGMETGSRIMTSLAALAWLPNLMLWAVSWICGAGFAVGELGTFTMWLGQSSELPALPVFALLPEAISDDRVRLALLCLVPALCAAAALLAMLLPSPMRVRAVRPGSSVAASSVSSDGAATEEPKPSKSGRPTKDHVDHPSVTDAVWLMLRHAVAFACALGLAAACLAALLALSCGSLGRYRLAHVGVDVAASLRAFAGGVGLGLSCTWLAVVVSLAAVYGIHWLIGRRRGDGTRSAKSAKSTHQPSAESESAPEESADEGKGRAGAVRSVASTSSEPEDRPARTASSARSVRSARSTRATPAADSTETQTSAEPARRPRTVRSATTTSEPTSPSQEETDDNS